MPKKKPQKKKSSKRRMLSRSRLIILAASFVVVVLLIILFQHHSKGDSVQVTAPSGSVTRTDQLNASEVSEESKLDSTSDTQHIRNVDSDAAQLGQVSGTADEN